MRLALRHKEDLEHLGTIQDAITLKQGLSFGAVWTVYHVARRLGIEQALGTTRAGKLALWHVMARVIDQGSRLSAVRLAMAHAACDILGLGPFDEDALYENLDWLAGARIGKSNGIFALVSLGAHPRNPAAWTLHRLGIQLPAPAGQRAGAVRGASSGYPGGERLGTAGRRGGRRAHGPAQAHREARGLRGAHVAARTTRAWA